MRLNLGSGSDRLEGYVNVDSAEMPGVDQVWDLDQYPWPWEDASVSRIRAFDVWEHLRQPLPFMREAWRVLTVGGILDIHTVGVLVADNGQIVRISPNYFRDPDHLRASDPHSFDYWIPGTYLNQRYGAAYAQGCHFIFPPGGEPKFTDGHELQLLLRKIT